MKKYEKEIEKRLLDNEKEVVKKLEKTYEQALDDIDKELRKLDKQIQKLVDDNPDNETLIRSKIYQRDYQKMLKGQVKGALEILKSEHVKSIDDYLKLMYEDGFLTQIFRNHNEGIPVLVPINHKLMVKATTYDTEEIPLSKRLYTNIEKTKEMVIAEIARGISTGMNYNDMARNIKNALGVSFRKARQIAQNEGHRVVTDATMDAIRGANEKGADQVKQWSCIYDGKTRPVHAELDRQYVEVEDYFTYSGGKVFAPKKFGKAALDINCRCRIYGRPRWAVEGEDTVLKRDNITGELIEAKNYAEWKEKYYNVVGKSADDTFDVKTGTKTLKDAMKEEDYKEYLNILNNHEDQNIKKIYANYADKINSVRYKANGGVYSPSGNYIEFGYDSGMKYEEIHKFSTLAHEYGHFFDAKLNAKVHFKEIDALNSAVNFRTGAWFKKGISSSDEFLEAVRKDKEYIKSIFNKDVKQHLYDHDGSAGVQDAIDGLFVKSRIRWGHGETYYNRKYNATKNLNKHKIVQDVYKELGFDASSQVKVKNIMRQYEASSEMWANIMSAYVCGGKELEFVKEYLPNSYKAMIEILKGVE